MTIEGTDPRIKEIIQSLGISLENLQEVVIHFKPDDIVYADAIYVIPAKVPVPPEQAEFLFKRYRLEEALPDKPFVLGKKVRIKPKFENENDIGKFYYLTVLGETTAVIKWDNITDSNSKPFTIELYKLEML
jgi:hypothetical protein